MEYSLELNYEFKPEEYFEYGEFCGKIIARINNFFKDINVPLFGLVESCFNGIRYDELKNKIVDKLNLLSTEIQKLLDLNISNPTPF